MIEKQTLGAREARTDGPHRTEEMLERRRRINRESMRRRRAERARSLHAEKRFSTDKSGKIAPLVADAQRRNTFQDAPLRDMPSAQVG